MRVLRRPLAPGETDHELIWLSISLSSLATAVVWLALGLPWPRCAFHALTGLPCVTCGATRSAIAFFHGDIMNAWKWNPLIFSFLCGLSVFDIYALGTLVMRTPRWRIAHFSRREKIFLRVSVVALLGLNWIYLLSHYKAFA